MEVVFSNIPDWESKQGNSILGTGNKRGTIDD